MKKQFSITGPYLYIPIRKEADKQNINFYIEDNDGKLQRWTQYKIPVDSDTTEEYPCDFYAEIPMEAYVGQTLIMEGESIGSFFDHILISDKKELPKSSNAKIHLAAYSGWTNDPNGLVYQGGVYHFYFQYNPVDVAWDNMTWGHAVSKDLLHWEQHDLVMLPDEDGTIFSGCGLVNQRGMLGLPEESLLFYYTAAGNTNEWSHEKRFTQKIAYSLDKGETLIKIKEPCIPSIYQDERDPKIFWHEETGAYIMVLYLRGNEFGIFRSVDLKHWEQTQTFHMEDGWECPDLFCLTSEEGEICWFFWSADGFYYAGDFNGYQFVVFQERHTAYFTKLPYAAQTFSNVKERLISVPWLRTKNDGRNFTGTYGIPVELSFEKREKEIVLIQQPVREMLDQMEPVQMTLPVDNKNKFLYNNNEGDTALVVKMHLNTEFTDEYIWKINGMTLQYSAISGMIMAESEKMLAGYGYRDVVMIIDDKILEVFFDDGRRYGAFELGEKKIHFEVDKAMVDSCEFYEIR